MLCWVRTLDVGVDSLLPWSAMVWVFAALVVLGVVICVAAAAVATNRYLRKNYDEMFN